MTNPLIIAFDVSSLRIGYVVRGDHVIDRGVIRLPKSDISERCRVAKWEIEDLLMRYAADAVAIESPVARFAKAVIPQCRVGAMVLLACAEHALAWCEVTPTAAKLALTDDGAATKREMLQAAAAHFGYQAEALEYLCHREEWGAWDGATCVFGEHEADALGVAMGAVAMVEVVA